MCVYLYVCVCRVRFCVVVAYGPYEEDADDSKIFWKDLNIVFECDEWASE